MLNHLIDVLFFWFIGPGCDSPTYVPDVFLMSVLLFIGTYIISVCLKEFKTAPFFPTKV